MKNFIRTKEGIYDLKHPHKSFFVIKNRSVDDKNCYVSWRWDDWKDYFLIDSFNCILFPYHSAKDFIKKLKQEKIDYEDLVIELSPYYSKCRQADTVEELCDCFIIKYVESNTFSAYDTYEEARWVYYHDKQNTTCILYGAIDTETALKYVGIEIDDEGLKLI